MADSDYGGYGGGGYSDGYAGGFSGGDGLSALEPTDVGSFGPVANVTVGDSGFGGGGLSPLEQMSLQGWGPVVGVNADVGFDAIGDLSPLSPMDVGSFGPVASVTAGQTSGLDSVTSLLERLSKNPLAMVALSKAIPGLGPVMGMVNLARASQTPQGAAKAWGGIAGSTLGGAVAGAPGAFLGGLAGQFAGSKSGGLPGYTGERTAQEPGSGGTGMDLEGIAGSLGQLYQAGRAGRESGQMASTLGDLYGQNSPYAQALRQQLERKDAAAGRRSQYGPREVELQARLAQLYSQNAPQTMAAQAAAREARNRKFAAGLGLAKETGLLNWGQRQLRDIWGPASTGTDMTGFQSPYEMPSYSDWASSTYTPSTMGNMGTGTFGAEDFFLNY